MNKYLDFVDKHRQLILDTERYIWKNPETGYKEVKTSKYLEDAFIKLGYDIVRADNIPGFDHSSLCDIGMIRTVLPHMGIIIIAFAIQ